MEDCPASGVRTPAQNTSGKETGGWGLKTWPTHRTSFFLFSPFFSNLSNLAPSDPLASPLSKKHKHFEGFVVSQKRCCPKVGLQLLLPWLFHLTASHGHGCSGQDNTT